jgi:hypothetical protein
MRRSKNPSAAYEFAVYIDSNMGSRRAIPRRRAHLLIPGRIHGKRGDQQAL